MPKPKKNTDAFIEWLWTYRAKHRIDSRNELARRFGVPVTSMAQWLNKGYQPSLAHLGQIARATGEDVVTLAMAAGYAPEIAERARAFLEDPVERLSRKIRAYDKISVGEREALIAWLQAGEQEQAAQAWEARTVERTSDVGRDTPLPTR